MLVSAPSEPSWYGGSLVGRGAVLKDQMTQQLVSMKSGARVPQRLRPNQRMELAAMFSNGSVMLFANDLAVRAGRRVRPPAWRRSSCAIR